MRRYSRLAVGGLFIAAAMTNYEAQAAERLPLVTGPDLQLPSMWRVLLVFIFVGVLGYSATLLLKKLKPWLTERGIGVTDNASIKLISHRKLSRTLNVYIIETENKRFMLVHSPQSTATTRLDNWNGSNVTPIIDAATGERN